MESKGNTVLLTVIGVATLLVALVGATFAYFTATLNNDAAQSISVTTATPVGLVYTGSKLELPNAQPGMKAGDKGDIKFTVNNPSSSTVAQTYDLNLIVDTNDFTYTSCTEDFVKNSKDSAKCTSDTVEQLVVTIGATSDKATQVELDATTFNLTDGATTAKVGTSFPVVSDQRIEIGETQTYTISIEFVELGYPQDNNQGDNFSAHIEISDAVSVQ